MITLAAVNAAAQVAGSVTIGVPAAELVTLAKGWSAKNQILGKTVYNEKDKKVGQVDDIIVTPDKRFPMRFSAWEDSSAWASAM
jgi:hypothetical protein